MDRMFFKKCVENINIKLGHLMVPTKFNVYTLRQAVLKKDPFLLMSGGAYFRENVNDPSGEIHICMDIAEWRMRSLKRSYKYHPEKIKVINRQDVFLTNWNIPITNYSLFLMILLHEVGHSVILKNFSNAGMIEEYAKLSEVLHEREYLDYDNDEIEEIYGNMSFDYYTNFIEARADIFAMENFILIWDMVNKYIV